MVEDWLEDMIDWVQNFPFIVEMNFLFTLLFTCLIILCFSTIIFLRIKKTLRNRSKKLLEAKIVNFISQNIFEGIVDQNQITLFRLSVLHKSLAQKIALKQFLIFAENFKGEAFTSLQTLFLALELDKFTFDLIEKGAWYKKTMAIYVISEMKIENDQLIRPFLKSKQEELREQAIFYFIRTSEQEPLSFLEDLQEELNLWEQIFIEDSLLNFYEGETPDFAPWLTHPLKSVVLFAIRMIYVCNQFTNIPQLIPFLEHEDPDIRKCTIIALKKLSYENLLALILPNFAQEHEQVQKEMIKAIEVQGELTDLYKIYPYIEEDGSPEIKIDYARTQKKMIGAS